MYTSGTLNHYVPAPRRGGPAIPLGTKHTRRHKALVPLTSFASNLLPLTTLLTSYLLPLTFNLLPLTSNLLPLTSHLLPLTSYLLLLTTLAQCTREPHQGYIPLTSHLLPLTSYYLLLTSGHGRPLRLSQKRLSQKRRGRKGLRRRVVPISQPRA